MIIQFKDIKQGQWFRNVGDERIFVKLQETLPSGYEQFFMRMAVEKGSPEVNRDMLYFECMSVWSLPSLAAMRTCRSNTKV